MDVLMPQLGETVAEGKITTWFKAIGDAVKPGDNLFEIETDKVSMEVPATSAGVLQEIRVGAGEVAPVGAVVAVIAEAQGTAAVTQPAAALPQAAPRNGSENPAAMRATSAAGLRRIAVSCSRPHRARSCWIAVRRHATACSTSSRSISRTRSASWSANRCAELSASN